MRIMFLNVWGGAEEAITPYLRKAADSIDIFCLQEVHRTLRDTGKIPRMVLPKRGKRERYHNIKLFNELEDVLMPTHVGFHVPSMRGLHDMEGVPAEFFDYGLACFCKVALRPETVRTGTLHRGFGEYNDDQPASRSIVSFVVRSNGHRVLIAQMHGLWDGRGKSDTPERFIQFRKAAEHIASHRRDEARSDELPVVFGGDFNLTSDCAVLKKLINGRFYGPSTGECLNHKFGVTDTRTVHYPKEIREADYALASKSLNASLQIDAEVLSDHAALIVEI